MERLLVSDDDDLLRGAMVHQLRRAGYAVLEARNGLEAVDLIERVPLSVMLLDLKMPHMDGMSVLRRCRTHYATLPIIVTTGQRDVASAVEATRLGAVAYLVKPFAADVLSQAVTAALSASRNHARAALTDPPSTGYGRMIGRSPSMLAVFDKLRRLESVDVPTVLISGESGTGKDLVAQAIHHLGPRKERPYVEVDCAAIPETLIESELFGHEKGAFTDAHQSKPGLFEVAGNGVLFLDEIGELAIGTQAKLLRALENRRFKRVGGVVELRLDAAVVAATNRDLKKEIKAGRFREDLYFRLNVVPIDIPPLRRRTEDVEAIAVAMVERISRELGRTVSGVSSEALQALRLHPWPGNVRELRNVIERAVVLKDDGDPVLRLSDLAAEVRSGQDTPYAFELPPEGADLKSVERSFIEQALERTRGNQARAARLLGISRFALRHRMEKHGIDRAGKRSSE